MIPKVLIIDDKLNNKDSRLQCDDMGESQFFASTTLNLIISVEFDARIVIAGPI